MGSVCVCVCSFICVCVRYTLRTQCSFRRLCVNILKTCYFSRWHCVEVQRCSTCSKVQSSSTCCWSHCKEIGRLGLMPNHRRVWSIVADGCVFGAKGALIMKLLGTNTHTQRGPHLFFWWSNLDKYKNVSSRNKFDSGLNIWLQSVFCMIWLNLQT